MGITLEQWKIERDAAFKAVEEQLDTFIEYAEVYWDVADTKRRTFFDGTLKVAIDQTGASTLGIIDKTEFFDLLQTVKGWVQRAEEWEMPLSWQDDLRRIWRKQIEIEFINRKRLIER